MLHRLALLIFLTFGLFACKSEHPDNAQIKTSIDSVSYALGADIARHYMDQGLSLNSNLIYQGFRDKYQKDSLKLSDEQIEMILDFYAAQLNGDNQEALEQKARVNQNLQRDFLSQNELKEDVTTLASGLQYKVLEEGEGDPPQIDNTVQVDYQGRLLNGEVFTPPGIRELELSEMIPGLQEALTLMKPGDHWELYIPSELAWGEESRSQIPPNSLLIFDLKVLQIL